jgi:hypothetical protein
MMQLEVMSEKSTMSAPIPEFCDRKSYDDIRINMIRKHSERREMIVREKEELFSQQPRLHNHRSTLSVSSRYKNEKVLKKPEDEVLSNLSCKNTDKLVLRAFTRNFNTAC